MDGRSKTMVKLRIVKGQRHLSFPWKWLFGASVDRAGDENDADKDQD